MRRTMGKQVLLLRSGKQEMSVSKETECLHIDVCDGTSAQFYLDIKADVAKLCIEMEVAKGSEASLFIKNDALQKMQLQLLANVRKGATMHFGYCDLECGQRQVTGHIQLLEEGANVDMRSVSISQDRKCYDICIEHLAPHTSGEMQHYALVEDTGSYVMNACGKIIKGAYNSVSHQATRVLTLSEEHHSSVTPTLLIDENDVKASHAMTLGQPDENQLYYLQTRGLSRKEALGLLSIGYLLPIVAYVNDADKQQELKNEIEKRVGLHA